MNLCEKVVLITGASRRVGLAIAGGFAAAGARIALHYHRSADQAAAAADALRSAGAKVTLFQADLTSEPQIAAMFEAIAGQFAHLDVLVNNAGVFYRTPLESITVEQWDFAQAVNARGAAICIRCAIPLMRPGGGAIVNITDISAEKSWASYSAYCASKAALQSLTKSAAKSLAGDNIRVNAVAPGLIGEDQGLSQWQLQSVLEQIPMRRAGRVEDVAAAVVFLAQQDYITGQTLRVDGGWHTG